MRLLIKEIKKKVKKYLRESECASGVFWGANTCTLYKAKGEAAEDGMEVYYYPVSCSSVTLKVD